nr:hypothetical protein [Kineococcus vitellinus]
MAEYMDDDPVWDSDVDHVGPVVLDDLGVSPTLTRRLQAWNERYNRPPLTKPRFGREEAKAAWLEEGLRLAYALQNELPDIEISCFEDGDRRPVRDRRGR